MSRFSFAVTALLLVLACTAAGFYRLHIDTNVLRSLPTDDPVIASGLTVFEHHPIQDQIAIDVASDQAAPDTLAQVSNLLEQRLRKSGLFAKVGSASTTELFPSLITQITETLPLLFSAEELKTQVAPRLTRQQITTRVEQMHTNLASMEGMGQARFFALDPLALREIVLAKLAPLAPTLNVEFYKGHLLSKDHRHMLVTAKPKTQGTDSAAARQLTAVLAPADQEIQQQFKGSPHITLTPVGAYRATLDNELIIRHDVNNAMLFATIGIALLLLVAFPRPLLGLLSLLPAFAGVGIAVFVYSLFHHSISIMVLGFGSAIISITVDYGVTYLLFLDGAQQTSGQQVSREVHSVGIMTVATSVGAFLLLSLCTFPIFKELGQFTALGILASYAIVHGVFPRLFPTLPPAARRNPPLRTFIEKCYATGRIGAIIAALFALCLLPFARPDFHVSLTSMNTVSQATEKADALFASTWGDAINTRVFLMTTAPDMAALMADNDATLSRIEDDTREGMIASAFVPSMVFPGGTRSTANLRAWKSFWDGETGKRIANDLHQAALAQGFTPQAFARFTDTFRPDFTLQPTAVPDKYFEMLGISRQHEQLVQVISMTPGKGYQGQAAFSQFSGTGHLLDMNLFTAHIAEHLFSTFSLLFITLAGSVALLLLLYTLDLRLTLITLVPSVFSFICTLGTLHLLERPLDIPSLMLSIVILGMGIDYSIYCVRAHQRYRDPSQPAVALIHMAVFIGGTSTMLGFGALCVAHHTLLRSIGVTSILGIGYSLIGAFLLLPPLLQHYTAHKPATSPQASCAQRVRARYRGLEAYPRMFARWKLRLDPLCTDLTALLADRTPPQTIIDIGCGYGVPACWCLEQYPNSSVYGLDPDRERVRVASFAFGTRGMAMQGFAPTLPPVPTAADLVLLLDMLHYLDDTCLAELLTRCHKALRTGGTLVMRYAIVPKGNPSWTWRLEYRRVKACGNTPYYRTPEEITAFCVRAGYRVQSHRIAPANPELAWLLCEVEKNNAQQ